MGESEVIYGCSDIILSVFCKNVSTQCMAVIHVLCCVDYSGTYLNLFSESLFMKTNSVSVNFIVYVHDVVVCENCP